jgi:hypothetical protein
VNNRLKIFKTIGLLLVLSFFVVGATLIPPGGGDVAIFGSLRLLLSGSSNYIELKSPVLSSDLTFTLPSSDGSSGQRLSTDGSGVLSWVDPADLNGAAITFGTDAQGVYRMQYLTDTVAHYGSTNVDGVKIQAGGKTLGYWINTYKATGWNTPQFYFKDFDFANAPSNIWGAPMLFNFSTSGGNNRAIAINMSDTSTTGSLQVTGIEVDINSPSDRGGDSSGIYVNQSGGGNAISIFKLGGGGTGFAIETSADGGNHTIFGTAENGYIFHGKITGTGGGVNIFPSADTNLTRRAFKVSTSDNLTEKFYVALNGEIYSAGSLGLGITPSEKLHAAQDGQFVAIFEGASNVNYEDPNIKFYRAQGSLSSKSSVQSGNELSSIASYGWDGNSYEWATVIMSAVDGVVSDGVVPGKIYVYTRDTSGNAGIRLCLKNDGSLGLNTTTEFGSGAGVLSLANASTSPTTPLVNAALLYASNGEMHVYDAAGNDTQISPHNKEGEWVFRSCNKVTGRCYEANMELLVFLVEQLTGEKIVREWYEK